MRNLIILGIVFLSISSKGQITITSADMALANDTFRLSTAANAQLFDFELTDTNYLWDFTGLMASSQRLEDYVPISGTPSIYNLVFMYPTVATIAAKRPNTQFATITITDGFNFYKKTSSKFSEVGFGANIQSIPLPVKYQTEDVIYRFPMTYGAMDSSISNWNVAIPSLGSIYEVRNRVNQVDGWGIVKTPYGDFSCLRIKSVVNQKDSIKYDASPIPLPVIPQTYTEYIWLAPSIGYPVLKATERNMVTTVEYLDSIKYFINLKDVSKANSDSWRIFPNPSAESFCIQSDIKFEMAKIVVYSVDGKKIFTASVKESQLIDVKNWAEGLYFVHIEFENQNIIKKLIIN